jgi:hypothetical protein
VRIRRILYMCKEYKFSNQGTNTLVHISLHDSKTAYIPKFFCRELGTYKAIFTNVRTQFKQLACVATYNIYATHHSTFKRRFNIKVLARILDDYVIQNRLGRELHTDMAETLPLSLRNMPPHVPWSMWFQHNVVPPPFCTSSLQLA